MEQNQPTGGEWHAVEFAGFWHILDQPYYEGGNVLDAEHVGQVQAKQNAELAAMAPEMKRQLVEKYREISKLRAEVGALHTSRNLLLCVLVAALFTLALFLI